SITNAKVGWIFAALLVLLVRDAGYVFRIRHLTDKQLTWVSSIFIIILWEFASAITPSVVGGTAVVVFIINKEGIKFGKSLAYVMLTAVLDNLFFVIASLLTFILVPFEIFPQTANNFEVFGMYVSVKMTFAISVCLVGLYTFVMIYGLLIRPRAFKWILIRLTGIRLLKRWRKWAVQTGSDMILAAEILREKKLKYWLVAVLSTIFIWSARYFMLNCLIAAFSDINVYEHLLIFGRQIIMWVVMLISPTPGSAGTAEFVFPLFFSEFFKLAAFSGIVAIFWRLFTYYAYLGLGAFFLPRWIRRVFNTKPKEEQVVTPKESLKENVK
ncbi:MAG: lysylphosphatidylglycerol synthase transmembrane domain-containing protein, partial [Bacteroidota bacterium]